MRFKKFTTLVLAVTALTMSLSGCALFEETPVTDPSEYQLYEPIPADATIEALEAARLAAEEAAKPVEEKPTMPEGMYASELTGLPVSNDIADQRPVAFMIDNDARALPHFGLSNVDVMYEMMNSTANDRVTRLMCLFKDWGKIEKVGSIRSVRPTNIILASEWNAVLCHDGGPYYIDEYFNKGYSDHFSGTFSRVNNGKATEFTEFCLTGDLEKNFTNSGASRTYNSHKQEGNHFQFVEYGEDELVLDDESGALTASTIAIPFPNQKSTLVYNEETQSYDYKEFGEISVDGGNNQVVTFKNAILISCSFHQYDEHGYMIYNVVSDGTKKMSGYYATNGKAIPITWEKTSENGITHYYKENGEEITVNSGSTYIGIVPSDSWSSLSIS